ncbi:MAG TPA: hypothetical protein VFA33_04625 [Bryobacteraceae bacterium]|nr:hypothetical protein [Bryobacteraceae bacterium]
MRYLFFECLRHPSARVIPLIVLWVILPAGASAGSVTSIYNSYFNVGTDGYYEPQVLPIAGFDSSLGKFHSATVNLTLDGTGGIGYRCDPWGDCGDWVYDPSTGENTWVPNLYPYSLGWQVGVFVAIFPEQPTVPAARIVDDARSFLSSSCGEQWFCLDGTAAFSATSSDPVFAADPRLVAFFEPRLSVTTQNPETYQFSTGWYSGDMTLSVRYDYQSVPEPSLTAMTFLVLISLQLMRKLATNRLPGA